MPELTQDDERAVERLSFYMLKEAYGATASVLEKLDPSMAKTLFDRIERQIEEALQRIHVQQSEGSASTAIATAIAETLVPVLDDCHSHETGLRSTLSAASSAEPASSKGVVYREIVPPQRWPKKTAAA